VKRVKIERCNMKYSSSIDGGVHITVDFASPTVEDTDVAGLAPASTPGIPDDPVEVPVL
jgi:hypothetical protein